MVYADLADPEWAPSSQLPDVPELSARLANLSSVDEDGDQQPEVDDPPEEQEHRPEEVQERVVRGERHGEPPRGRNAEVSIEKAGRLPRNQIDKTNFLDDNVGGLWGIHPRKKTQQLAIARQYACIG